MKIKCFAALLLFAACIASSLVVKSESRTAPLKQEVVSAVTLSLSDSEHSSKILASRFLNMLNHNYVYGDAFYSADEIVNLSVVANLNMADENREFIKSDIVYSFVRNMYGVAADSSATNPDFPQKPGYIYIAPCGYTVYKHTNAVITENEDGTYTVTTEVTVDGHDSEKQTLKATSLFVKNPESVFGFNLVYSEISDSSLSL